MTSNIGSASVSIDADTSALESKLGGVASRLGGIVVKAFAAIGATGAALTGVALKTAAEFETAATKIINLTGVTADEMAILDDEIIQIGKDAGIAGTEAANAFFFLASGLGDADLALDSLDAASRASAVGLGDVESISRVLVTTFSQYGREVGSATEVMDIFGAAATVSTLAADELAAGLQGVIPQAAQMGISLDDLATTAALISPAFASGGEAGNALQGVLTALNRATPQAEAELEKVGLSMAKLRDIAGEQGLSGVIQTLGVAFEGNEDKLTKVLGRVEGTRAVMGFLGRDATDVAAAFDTVSNRAGFLDETFERVAGTAEFTSSRLSATISARFTELGGKLLPRVTDRFAGLIPVVEKVFDGLDFVAEFVLSLIDIFEDAGGGVEGFQAVLESLGDIAGRLFESLIQAAQKGFDSLVRWLSTGGARRIVEGILSARERIFSAAITIFEALVKGITAVLPSVIATIRDVVLPTIVNFIATNVPILLDAAVQLFLGLVDGLVAILPDLVTTLTDVITTVVGLLVDLIPVVVDAAIVLFMGIVDALIAIVPPLLTVLVEEVIPSLAIALVDAVPVILDAAVTAFIAIVDALVLVLPDLLTTLGTVVIPQLLDAIIDALPLIIDAALTLFEGLADGLIEALPAIITALVGPDGVLLSLISKITEEDTIAKIIDAALTLFLGLVDGLVAAIDPIITALIEEVIPAFIASFPQVHEAVASAAWSLFINLAVGLGRAIPNVLAALGKLLASVTTALGKGAIDFVKIGAGWIKDLGRGIKNAAAGLIRTFKNAVIKPITNLWPFSPAKDGPFRQFPPEKAGENVVRLFAEGMRRGADAIPSGAFGSFGPGGGVNMGGVSLTVTVNGDVSRERAAEVGRSMGDAVLDRLSRARVTQ